MPAYRSAFELEFIKIVDMRGTTNFYVPLDHISGDRLRLPDDEARHAAKVLRVSAGDEISVVDGEGGWYRVELSHADRRAVAGEIIERRRDVGEPTYQLTIAIGVLKQRARFETFLEKAAELGVSRVVPMLTERTEREQIRFERSEGKLVAAMKQCGRSRLVELCEPTPYEDFLESTSFDLAVCCHERSGPDDNLMPLLATSEKPPNVAVLVGPEGGLTDSEVDSAQARGWRTASLGARRLRAETAAIVAAAGVAFAYQPT